MKNALKAEHVNAIFAAVESLIPPRPEHPLGCHRPRVPDDVCFRGILLRLVTGESWETIEFMMNWVVSDTTLRARRNEWIEAGVFDALMAEALAAYDKIIGIDTSDVMIDGSNKLAPCGGEKAAAGPGQKGRKGWKWCVAVDRDGIPLAWTIDGANRNDYKMLTPTLDAYFGVDASLPIGTLHLDRGFGYKTIGEKLADYPVGDLNVLWRRDPNEGRVKLVGFGRRWVVERTNSWLCSNGQLRRNTDRKAAHRHAAMCLAAAFIIVTKLVQHRTANCVPIR